jgi:hypothetical protein
MIDIAKLPTITFDLGQCLHAAQIKSLMKKMGIKFYCYAFTHKSTIMKYGMSADNDWMRGSFGERIYRQSFHIPGWPSKPSANSAGNDMVDVIKHFPSISKNDVCVKVWDMTNYPFAVANYPKTEMSDCERTLLEIHEQLHNTLPVGNIRDERLIPKKSRVSDVLFDYMFDPE